MIRVKFIVEHGVDAAEWLNGCSETMPWIQYLRENATDCHVMRHYAADTFQDMLEYVFYLEPAKQTYYLMKYST